MLLVVRKVVAIAAVKVSVVMPTKVSPLVHRVSFPLLHITSPKIAVPALQSREYSVVVHASHLINHSHPKRPPYDTFVFNAKLTFSNSTVFDQFSAFTCFRLQSLYQTSDHRITPFGCFRRSIRRGWKLRSTIARLP